jgi:SAM-dependent methyltransferase
MATSFRDPDGCLVTFDHRVLRFVRQSGEANLRYFLDSKTAVNATNSGNLVTTAVLDPRSDAVSAARLILDPDEEFEAVLEHERIPFPSFPYEWVPEMLFVAGQLTLDLAERCLADGIGLKDASPYNILFRDTQPVFVDVLSFEKREPGDPIWLPYAQFVRTFVLPLLAVNHLGLRMDQVFLTRRDGLEPEEIYRLASFTQKLRPPFLTLATIPTWLNSKSEPKASVYQKRTTQSEQAAFVLRSLFRRLRRQLRSAHSEHSKKSAWSGYMKSVEATSPNYLKEKEEFVRRSLAEFKPRRLLDVGCNSGHFSRVASQCGASVVAIDRDTEVVSRVWQLAFTENLSVLPLVIDITRPTPGVGWHNAENKSFLNRARGSFEAVLMVAVIHHLLVTERIPLPEIMGLAAELTNDLLIAEFVPADDPMFRRIARGRDQLFEWFDEDYFRRTCEQQFSIIRTQKLGETQRVIYLLRRKTP